MRKAIGIGGFGAIAIALMFVATTAPMVGADDPPIPSKDITVKLMAGQDIEAGTIHVWQDGAYFYIDIDTTGGWTLTDTHVAMSVDTTPFDGTCDLNGIPRNKQGQPKNGQFPYEPYETGDTYAKYKISFSDVGYEDHNDDFVLGHDEVCIAVHTVVEKGSGETYQEQTGWGQGTRFTNKNCSMYFCWLPCKLLKVPEGKFSTYYDLDESDSYWDATITIPDVLGNEEYQYLENWHEVWCIETGQTLYHPDTKDMQLISSLNVPAGLQVYDKGTSKWVDITQEKMNKVNWILTYYHEHTANGYSWQDIQWAIWTTIGLTPDFDHTHSTIAHALVTNADGNFYPLSGDYVAVILHNVNNQDCILEVDP